MITPIPNSTSRLLTTTLIVLLIVAPDLSAREAQSLSADGIHDPENPVLQFLQTPVEALSRLPADTAGNRVDWVRALREGYIRPRSTLKGNKSVDILDTDIVMSTNGGIPRVLFPHKAHTEWLDCGNCHETPFVSETGANPITMGRVLEGEFCGMCHGAVSFPLTECNRCHSVP